MSSISAAPVAASEVPSKLLSALSPPSVMKKVTACLRIPEIGSASLGALSCCNRELKDNLEQATKKPTIIRELGRFPLDTLADKAAFFRLLQTVLRHVRSLFEEEMIGLMMERRGESEISARERLASIYCNRSWLDSTLKKWVSSESGHFTMQNMREFFRAQQMQTDEVIARIPPEYAGKEQMITALKVGVCCSFLDSVWGALRDIAEDVREGKDSEEGEEGGRLKKRAKTMVPGEAAEVFSLEQRRKGLTESIFNQFDQLARDRKKITLSYCALGMIVRYLQKWEKDEFFPPALSLGSKERPEARVFIQGGILEPLLRLRQILNQCLGLEHKWPKLDAAILGHPYLTKEQRDYFPSILS